LIALLLATVVVNTFITVRVFSYGLWSVSTPETHPPLDFITAFVLTAALDVILTSLMLFVLLRARSQVVSRRLHMIIGRLHTMLWEAALPPCICAIAACVVYSDMSLENLWDMFLQSILGKLYVISLFTILNGRADLKRVAPSSTRASGSAGLSRYWISGAEVRLNISTVIASLDDLEELSPTTDQNQSDCDLRQQSRKNGSQDRILEKSDRDLESGEKEEVDLGHGHMHELHTHALFAHRPRPPAGPDLPRADEP